MSPSAPLLALTCLNLLGSFAPRPPIDYPIRDSPLTISLSQSADDVAPDSELIVQCRVSTDTEKGRRMSKFRMFLRCPVASEFCFQNCQPMTRCHANGCERIRALNNVVCRQIQQEGGELVFEYQVGRLSREWFGNASSGFQCASNGVNSQLIRLRTREEPPPPPPAPVIEATLPSLKPVEETTEHAPATKQAVVVKETESPLDAIRQITTRESFCAICVGSDLA